MVSSAYDLCSLAWGDQKGYICLSVRDTTVDKRDPKYWRDHILSWPADKQHIRGLLERTKTSDKDVYWGPTVYNSPIRSKDKVTDVSTLWADLDEVDVDTIPKHLKPTAVWESSPGRFQALWSLDTSLAPQYQQDLNRRLTYAIGADKGGWDLTQMLRVPGSHNHKYPAEPEVKLLYLNGHVLNPVSLTDDLPEVTTKVETMNALPDPKLVLAKIKTQARLKELIRARHAVVGTRSDRLWELECLLAEHSLTAEEIASIAQRTVWNKFKDRKDEITRLLTEATKAIAHTAPQLDPDEDLEELIEDDETHGPQTWSDFDREHKAITWLVADIWGDGEVGFISGLPKSYKSWLALDLAVSVATGSRFLGAFQSHRHNVLLIQEEDPKPVLQDRLSKVAAAKGLISVVRTGDNTFDMKYELPDNLSIISNQGFSLTDEWLESLEDWITTKDIKLVILDPLMMIAGGSFDEFKAFEFMNKVLKPLKRVRARTGAAIVIVHHHIKGSQDAGPKSMYGSVALWAWEEAALHLQVSGVGKVTAERFSKHTLLPPILIEVGDVAEMWSPTIETGSAAIGGLVELLSTMEAGATVQDLEMASGMSRDAVLRQLKSLEAQNKIEKAGSSSTGPGRPKTVWKAVKKDG